MYTLEKDLVNAFKGIAVDFLNSNINENASPFFIVEEFDSQYGIADLVIGTCNPVDPREFSRKSINLNWVRPVYNFNDEEEIEISCFMQTYGVSISTARKRFKEYVEAGFLTKQSNRQYKVVKGYRLLTNQIIAIEAKLKNWRRALDQAIRYKRFSNKSYVLLDGKYVEPALKNIQIFKEKNIGLMSMVDDIYTTHFQPTIQEAPQTHSYFRLNEAVFGNVREQLTYS